MYGAILGDIIGSTREFNPVKRKDFELFPMYSKYTDDTIMTIAVASALLEHLKTGGDFQVILVERMQHFGRAYPYPMGSYGSQFKRWLRSCAPSPYGSFGNGSAMRVCACGVAARSLEEALKWSEESAAVTHNHPEGIYGAQATAAAIYLAKTGCSKEEIRDYIREEFYELNRTLDEIRPGYRFDGTCQGSVPESIQAFLESTNFEDAIRNTISLGGDADTMGAITGAIAWAFYGRDGLTPDMEEMKKRVSLPADLQAVVDEFEAYLKEMN